MENILNISDNSHGEYATKLFDKVEFDQDYVSMMVIKNWDNLRQRIDPNMTERECMKWVFNGMING
jgi:hypothetical protein